MITIQNKSDTATKQSIDALNAELHLIAESHPHEAIEKAQSAKALAEHPTFGAGGYAAGLAQSDIELSRAYFTLSQYDISLQCARSAEYWAEQADDSAILMVALGRVGGAYARLSNYAKGMEYFNQQLRLAQDANDQTCIATAHGGLTIIHGEMGQYHESIHHATATQAYAEANGDVKSLAAIHNNLCRAYALLGDFEQALTHGHLGLTICEIHKLDLLGANCSSMGLCHTKMHQYDAALQYYRRALDAQTQFSNTYFHAIIMFEIAEIQYARADFVTAKARAFEALHLAEASKSQWIIFRTHELLSKIAQKQDDFKTALHHHQQFQRIQNTAIGEKNAEQMRYLQVSYEVDVAQREAEIYRVRTEELAITVNEHTADLQEALDRETILTNELALALDESRAINALRTNIISTVSHEFRTPMTVINTSADMLSLHAEKLSAEKRATLLGRIKNAISYMTDLMESVTLVETASENRHAVSAANVPFDNLCQAVSEALLTELDHPANLQILYDTSCRIPVTTDANLLKQIALNLITNAKNFSAESAPISVEIAYTAHGLALTITDQGIGIPPQDLDHIFKLFYRGSNIGQRRGLGAGLYITKSMVDALDGTITASSTNLEAGATFASATFAGATFMVNLPPK